LYEDQLEVNRLASLELEKEEKSRKEVSEVKAVKQKEEQWKTKLHLMNLNEDPLLTGQIKYILKKGKNTIGKFDKDTPPDIIIGGVGVVKEHCSITLKGNTAKLVPNSNPNIAKVYVNGKLVVEAVGLKHNDRILFGSYNYFVLKNPNEPEDMSIDWEYANKEIFKDQVKALTSGQEEKLQEKIKEMEEKYEAERKIAEENAQKKMEQELKSIEEKYLEYEEKLKEMKERGGDDIELRQLEEEIQKMEAEKSEGMKTIEKNIQKETERELQKQQRMREQAELRLQEQKVLEEDLALVIPKINEVNEICLQLGRLNYLYVPSILTEVKGNQVKSRICVKIYPDHEQDIYNETEISEFLNKYYLIQEKFQDYQYDLENNEVKEEEVNMDEEVKVFGVDIKNDWVHIGLAHIYTDTIGNLLTSNKEQTPVLNNKGKVVGELTYSIIPRHIEDDKEVNLLSYDSIEDFKGRTLRIILKIHYARGLPAKFSNEVVCKYKWIDEEADEYETEVNSNHTINPDFGYEKEHELFVDPYVIEHIWDNALVIVVYGKMAPESIEVKKKIKASDNQTLSNVTNTHKASVEFNGSHNSEVESNEPDKLRKEILKYKYK